MDRIKALPIWNGEVTIAPLGGGLTNVNYIVTDAHQKCVVRLGEDIPEHHVMRFNEVAASRAAHAAGLSPAVIYTEHGLTVLEYIESKTLSEADVRDPETLAKILPLIRSCHVDIPKYLRGPALVFWVFHVIRDYAARLQSGPYSAMIPELLTACEALEKATGPIDLVFGHNDLVPRNILDDGSRLWLIDWDYAGFNSPLFDLGGLASNNGFNRTQEVWLLENYFETLLTDGLWHRYQAMKTASLLREAMWSMVSEATSSIEFDYASYTADYLHLFQTAYAKIQS